MEFEGFDWDLGNRVKCQKHGVPLAEIEAAFTHRPLLILPDRDHPDERRFRAIGTTSSKRKLFIAFTMRGSAIRPISARYMHQREIDAYEKTYPDLQN